MATKNFVQCIYSRQQYLVEQFVYKHALRERQCRYQLIHADSSGLRYFDVSFVHQIHCTVNPEIFARILFSRIELKDIFDAKYSRLGHDLPLSVNDRVISPFLEDFWRILISRYAKFRENKTLVKNSNFTGLCICSRLHSIRK